MTEEKNYEHLLSVRDLHTTFLTENGEVQAVNGVNFKAVPFNNAPVIGVFAVCQYKDGGMVYEVMSRDDVEQCRKSSKAKNSPAWSGFWSEMAKKTVLRRLCKNLSIDMDAKAAAAFDAGLEISENANKDDLVIDGDMTEIETPEFE